MWCLKGSNPSLRRQIYRDRTDAGLRGITTETRSTSGKSFEASKTANGLQHTVFRPRWTDGSRPR